MGTEPVPFLLVGREVYDLTLEYKVPMRVAAYIAALKRLAVAMKFRGMY